MARRLFISYAHSDGTELARRLATDLRTHSQDVWLDELRLQAGSSWSSDIEQNIDACEVLLALLSRGSATSEICRGEHLRALRQGKRVIPLLVQRDADRPVYLESKQYLDSTPPLHSKTFCVPSTTPVKPRPCRPNTEPPM